MTRQPSKDKNHIKLNAVSPHSHYFSPLLPLWESTRIPLRSRNFGRLPNTFSKAIGKAGPLSAFQTSLTSNSPVQIYTGGTKLLIEWQTNEAKFFPDFSKACLPCWQRPALLGPRWACLFTFSNSSLLSRTKCRYAGLRGLCVCMSWSRLFKDIWSLTLGFERPYYIM